MNNCNNNNNDNRIIITEPSADQDWPEHVTRRRLTVNFVLGWLGLEHQAGGYTGNISELGMNECEKQRTRVFLNELDQRCQG